MSPTNERQNGFDVVDLPRTGQLHQESSQRSEFWIACHLLDRAWSSSAVVDTSVLAVTVTIPSVAD